MKATDNFKNIIKEYLDKRSESDELFALKYASEKTIEDSRYEGIAYFMEAFE